MDNVTHALAGCLLAEATTAKFESRGVTLSPRFRATAQMVGIAAAELPDVDLLYANSALGMGNLGYLLQHRGYTHTVMFALVGALLVWVAATAFRKEMRARPFRDALLALAVVGTISHLALDFSNSYGVHPFWPIVNSWYYGDAVFIVEPWLWIVALPPLMLLARSTTGRRVYAVILFAILLAAWLINLVGREVSMAFSIGALLCLLLARRVRPSHRATFGIAAWVAIELMFFAASWSAQREVQAAMGNASFRDAVLNPSIGNPLCFSALIVEANGDQYSATEAMIASVPTLRDVNLCVDRAAYSVPASNVHSNTSAVQWGKQWTGSRAELAGFVQVHCEIAAAMRFVRVPIWLRLPNDRIQFSDLRYGEGGFASVVTSGEAAACPRYLPPWTAPRADLLK